MDIFIVDGEDVPKPEDVAMLQALYSRSPKSVVDHLKKVAEVGSGSFFDTYYIGYGHKSIGDCGTTTLFIENISMLMAKAIQATPLYSGQEASTRYMDMASQTVRNPAGTSEGAEIQDTWMEFYKRATPVMVEFLKEKYPRQEGEPKGKYLKAINARSFDIMRGFLPAGCSTNASWHTNLRQAWDHLSELRHYPTAEVRENAELLLEKLQKQYPHSFHHKKYPEIEEYLSLCGDYFLYDHVDLQEEMQMSSTLGALRTSFGKKWWDHTLIKDRPAHGKLPHILDSLGQVMFEFPLDFGSFRDLQRHRNGVCRMPFLGTYHGFNKWYLDELAPSLRGEAEDLIESQSVKISSLDIPPEEKQYYVAMGFNVACETTRGLPGTIYMVELRSSQTVHPTMRHVAQEQGRLLQEAYPELTLHIDMSPDTWSIRRGSQDITSK